MKNGGLPAASVKMTWPDAYELSNDAPLNRVVRAACHRLARMEPVSELVRVRARRLAHRMDDVGPLRHTDMRVRVERITSAYARVVPLAHLVLDGCGITSTAGRNVGTAFLVRTPELVEDGLRTLLSRLLPHVTVEKRRLALGSSGLSMNPDLVFGGNVAVGDVKYRHLVADWHRGDLNQVVAFATGFRCSLGLLLGFVRNAADAIPRSVPVGPVVASAVGWVASETMAPAASAHLLGLQVRRWLTEV